MKSEVTVGKCHLKGTQLESGILVFKNIPFATAERWCAPEAVELPEGVYEPHEFGPAPIQPPPSPFWAERNHEPADFPQSEHCLSLNVWTADVSIPKKAVLFWVYGGSYIQGYNYRKSNNPEQFVKAHPELLVVAPNYRVGILGSLNLSVLQAPDSYRFSNNLALLDIVEALRWTQKNIAAFGGDPGRVTMYGHSAGSNAISHLMAMPAARGLFLRTICQSSYMADLGTVALDTSEEIACKFLELAGADTLEAALALTPEQILAAQGRLFGFHFGGSHASKMFSPVADGLVVDKEPFRHFVDGTFNGEQVMIGGSQGEYDQMFLKKDLEETRKFVIDRNADKHVTAEQEQAFIALHPEMTEKEALMTIHNELGLSLGGEWIGRACSVHVPVYEYAFCLRDPQEGWRALHGAPCHYVFGVNIPEGAPAGLQEAMMDTWAAFIETGDPNHSGIPTWAKYVPDGGVMRIDTEWKLTDGYWKEDFAFWKETFTENKWM